MMPNRHAIREEAFQILFAKQSNPDATLTDIYESLPSHADKIPAYLQTLELVNIKKNLMSKLHNYWLVVGKLIVLPKRIW